MTKIWRPALKTLIIRSGVSNTVKHHLNIAAHKIYLSWAGTFQQMQHKTKPEKKGIERLGVGLADGQQTFWWSLNVVCNKSHRRLRACWWLGPNVITERRWVSHFSSRINFFLHVGLFQYRQARITVQSQQRPAPSCFRLVGIPDIYPKTLFLCQSEADRRILADLNCKKRRKS